MTGLIIALLVANLVGVALLFRRGAEGGTAFERRLLEQLGEGLREGREESSRAARELRGEVSVQLKGLGETVTETVGALGASQRGQLETVVNQIQQLTEGNEKRLETLRHTVDQRVKQMQEGNEKKLEEMRHTVDEKLQGTLEKRLGESFSLVSERLEAVQRGLGDMQQLASGVGDLKRVLTNVKARGTWGEVQLEALLEQVLSSAQFSRNVRTREESNEQVEFAVKLPGPSTDSCVWLPIDSKFPQEDYLRLCEAADAGDGEAVKEARSALVRAVKASAKEIYEKYVEPPSTTDFAILFLPTEGLYAEVLRVPGLVEDLQASTHVVISGPTTLTAILNSLRLGFRTLAIEKRSSEVWKVLGAVKAEFGKFGEVLEKVKRQLATASSTIEQTGVRTRAMERKLRDVEQLPEGEGGRLLGLSVSELDSEPGGAGVDDPRSELREDGSQEGKAEGTV
ncbi:MAG: DNA recombination protein RmuC [Candidatus Binatia bacterium]